jgi:hypothetical protein
VAPPDWPLTGSGATPTGRFGHPVAWPPPAGEGAGAADDAFVSEATLALWAAPVTLPAPRLDATGAPDTWSAPPLPGSPRPTTPQALTAPVTGDRDETAPDFAPADDPGWTRLGAAASTWLAHRQRSIADEPAWPPPPEIDNFLIATGGSYE